MHNLNEGLYSVSQKTGPLIHFQITPTILVQYQQILVHKIVQHCLNGTCTVIL